MKRIRAPRRRRHRPVQQMGTAPGTLIPPPDAVPTEVRYLVHGPEGLREEGPVPVDDVPLPKKDSVLWVDVVGTANVAALEALGQRFGIHPLALEDVVNVNQRPKLEAFGEDSFIIVRMCPVDSSVAATDTEQVSILLRHRMVITFQERPGDCFGRVRERLRVPTRRIRQRGSDYLGYALLDAIIDGYQPTLDTLEERVEEIEHRLLDTPQDRDLKSLHTLRRELIALRRSIAPAREVVQGMMRETAEDTVVTEETRLFLRDCYDHVIRTVDQIDTFRELCASLMDLYLSTVSNRTNDVMKVLTMIATVFIPLSFMVGLYGMNFDTSSPWNMPELSSRYGYPALIAVMVVVAGAFLVYFKKKDWL